MTQLDRRKPEIFADRTDADRPLVRFAGRITADGSSGFRAAAGRYHIYAAWSCPFAQRVVIALRLAGLDDVVSVSYVDTEPGFDGHISVPTLWDKYTGRIVSNDFRSIGIDLATQFRAFADPIADTYPTDLADSIEDLDRWIGRAVTSGIVAASGDGPDSDEPRRRLLDTFALLNRRLARQRYLLGERLTEADIRLYVVLVRYDLGANSRRSINRGLSEYSYLWAYPRDLYSIPAFRDTTDFTTYGALSAWNSPAGRDELTSVFDR